MPENTVFPDFCIISVEICIGYGGNIMKKILVNKIKCKKCGDIIESKSVHDFKRCKCGAVAVDGGHDYLKRCGNLEDFEELSEYEK